jgi:hypothetical protein
VFFLAREPWVLLLTLKILFGAFPGVGFEPPFFQFLNISVFGSR